MSKNRALRTADDILTDMRGSRYYADPKVLADFLKGRFGLDGTDLSASNAAQAVIRDWEQAGYYKNRDILASFLESQFPVLSKA